MKSEILASLQEEVIKLAIEKIDIDEVAEVLSHKIKLDLVGAVEGVMQNCVRPPIAPR